jgi:hypothetical protein
MIADLGPWEITMAFELSLTLRENGIDRMPAAKWAAQIESIPSVQSLGLSLAQRKVILTRLQTEIVEQQLTRLSNRQRVSLHCGQARKLKDFHEIHYCSLFGEVATRVPRWRACACCTDAVIAKKGNRQRWVSQATKCSMYRASQGLSTSWYRSERK